jgi:hypothetical protein
MACENETPSDANELQENVDKETVQRQVSGCF